jgi:hypothetical protein
VARRATSFFNWVRDVRWVEDQVNGWQLRRISWLDPDAGCEARAEVVVHRATQNFLTKPYKLFVTGDLNPLTGNHPDGFVHWGVHLAPVVRRSGSGTAYLLDPALYSAGPLSWSSWRSRLRPGNFPVSYAVMDPSWYSPLGPDKANAAYGYDELEYEYLPLEWDRQIELGRDPRDVLGDNPPW